MIRFLATVFLMAILFNATGQNGFNQQVKKLLESNECKNASVGIHVTNVKTGDDLYGYNSEKMFIPASTLKLFTTGAALEILGGDYRFKTKIAYSGKIGNKVLKGDLVIVGGGDPALGSKYFIKHYSNGDFVENWVQQLKNAGIYKIEGNLVFDSSIYDLEEIPETWIWGDIGNYYGAVSNAFTVYDNIFSIRFQSPRKSGEPTQILSTNPEMNDLVLQNEVLSSDINSDQAYVFGSPIDKKRIIRGTIPKNKKSFSIKASIPEPNKILANDLFECLTRNGIFISGEILYEKRNPNELELLFVQESPALSEIVEKINTHSINLFAEHLVKQIAYEKSGEGNRVKGLEIINDFWKTKGIEGFFMEDGSGLSHFNAVSPENCTSVLNYMNNQSVNSVLFIKSLPNAGSGTLSGFHTEYFPGDSLKAKSGSMKRVLCYAGYLVSNTGKTLSFSILINHFSGSHSNLRNEIEKLLFEIKKSL